MVSLLGTCAKFKFTTHIVHSTIPGHRVELDPGITLRAKYGIKMKLERRN